MVRHLPLGLDDALKLMIQRLEPLKPETVELFGSVDRIAAEDLPARVNSPSVDASLKDGYAVISHEVADAEPSRPICLKITGHMAAGGLNHQTVESGTAVRVLTGARIPTHADAVLSDEFVEVEGSLLYARNTAQKGRNILEKGSDVYVGQIVVARGQRISPGKVGLLAASGYSRIPVFRKPSVMIIATGDEVVAPGKPLAEGKLYASNLMTLSAWCHRYRLNHQMAIVMDDPDEIREALEKAVRQHDAVITSGGAWTGDRDLLANILASLHWEKIFHRIRIGPGKAVGFGLLRNKPVFLLPGGPPSNLMGFLQIALPGLLRLCGHEQAGLPTAPVLLGADLSGRFVDWTQFVFGSLESSSKGLVFHPLQMLSRLQSMADAQAVVSIPEGQTNLEAGSVVTAQLLT